MNVKIKKIETDDETGEVRFETQHGRMANPPADFTESSNEVDEVGKRFKRRSIDLTKDQKDDLVKELSVMIEDWMDSRVGLEQKLREWNDLFEGVTPETDFPWPGACSIHLPLPKIKAREIFSTINRTTMRPVPFLNTRYAGPASLYEESKDFTRELEDFLEDKLRNDTNVHATLKEAIPPIIRDGTCPVQIIWETNYETVTDWKLYDDPQEFQKDYPKAEDAGISGAEYNRVLSLLGQGGHYEAEYEYMVATYDGPKAYIVPLIDFIHWPTFIPRIPDMALHGKQVWWTDYQLKQKVRAEMFSKDDVDEILAYHGEQRTDTLTTSRDRIEGINREGSKDRAQEYRIHELVYTTSLTDQDREDDVVRKYLIYYHHLSKKVLRVEHYPIRKGKPSYFALRFLRRDNRFLGMSLMDDISDLSMEADVLIRQMTNSRTITHVPSFKAKFTAKSVFDPSRKEFRFRPGATFYMADVNDVMQFDIRPVDLSGSSEQLMLMFQLIDMTTGASSALSGQANPIDPRAPARKQQEMLRQSSNRIDDYVGSILPDFEEIGQHVIDLYYQYAPDRIGYYSTESDGRILKQEMDRSKLFNPNIKFKVNGTSVFINPELEFERMHDVYTILGTDPTTATNPRIRRKALERLLMSARIDDEKAFLPNQKEMPEAFTTDEQEERNSKDAINKEKQATKISDAAAKHENALAVEKVKADYAARNQVLDAMLQVAQGGGSGTPGSGPSNLVPSSPAPAPQGGPPVAA